MTLEQLIIMQLKTIGVFNVGDSLDAEEAADAMLLNKTMVESWDAEGQLSYYVSQDRFSLVAGQGTYTWGHGYFPKGYFAQNYFVNDGDIATSRPVKLLSGFVRDINGTDYPLELITVYGYDSLTIKTETGRPYYLYYNPTFPLGTCTFFYIPDQVYTVFLETYKSIVNWTNLTDEISLPPEYLAAMHWNGAAEMCPMFKKPVSQKIESMALKTLAVVKRLNSSNDLKPIKMNIFKSTLGGFWKQGNIQSGNSY